MYDYSKYRNCLLEGRMRHKTVVRHLFFYAVFCGPFCWNARRVGEMDDLNLNKRPGPLEICAPCEDRGWSPEDPLSGLHAPAPASDSLDQWEASADGRPIRGCEIRDRKQILTDRVGHKEAKFSAEENCWKYLKHLHSIQVSRIKDRIRKDEGCHSPSSCSQITLRRELTRRSFLGSNLKRAQRDQVV